MCVNDSNSLMWTTLVCYQALSVMVGTKTDRINQNKGGKCVCINILPIFKLLLRRVIIFEITHVSCMLVWCDLHVARNVLCTAISRAVLINTWDFTKTLGTSQKHTRVLHSRVSSLNRAVPYIKLKWRLSVGRHVDSSVVSAWIDVGLGLCTVVVSATWMHISISF